MVDELNPEMNLTKKEVESLLEFDESDMPFEDFSHLADKFNDPILTEICQQYSNTISKVGSITFSRILSCLNLKKREYNHYFLFLLFLIKVYFIKGDLI